ncbi:SDR family NAD(P)-dependent oxidoreductase [Mycolicibacterium sphagni]|uniref:SDR family NAD(P)-dependent oxidoreductase n=1 Tax=Mycolicibacterium sphagni TaxID=1786 RepID=UPI0039752D67
MTVLQGKIALVTGGTTGIGLATAQRIAAEGAYVFFTGRNQPSIDTAIASIGSNATGIRSDITPGRLDHPVRVHGNDIRVNTIVPGPVQTPGLAGLARRQGTGAVGRYRVGRPDGPARPTR